MDALRIGVPEIDAISGIVQAGGAVSHRDKSYVNGNILGFTPDYYHVMEPRLIEGVFSMKVMKCSCARTVL